MASDDYMPPNDDEFQKWQATFMNAIKADPGKFGIPQADLTPAMTAREAWEKAFPACILAQQEAAAAVTAKDETRGTYEGILRGLARKVHGTPGMTNSIRAEVGLPEKGGARTSISAPSSKPLCTIEAVGHYLLQLQFVDENTPTRRAKPAGALGCQIWFYNGDKAPTDPAVFSFIALDTATPYVHEHPAASADKTVYYLLRWQNAKGETGPWSDIYTARVPA